MLFVEYAMVGTIRLNTGTVVRLVRKHRVYASSSAVAVVLIIAAIIGKCC